MHGVNDAARRHRPETDGRGGATFSRQSCVWTNTPCKTLLIGPNVDSRFWGQLPGFQTQKSHPTHFGLAETGPGGLVDALHAWKPLSGSEGSYKAVLAVASLKQNNGEIVFNGSVAKVTRSNADKVLYPHAQLMYYLW